MLNLSKSILGRITIFTLLCFCCSWGSLFGATCQAEERQNITVPIEQWTLLKQKVAEQQIVLGTLEEKLKTLKTPSEELRTQLNLAKEQLRKSQMELANAKNSLVKAESSIQILQASLETLRLQIEKERRIQKRVLWQNRVWSLLGGLGIGIALK